MTWVKIDDQMPEHPRIVAVGAEAKWLHIEGICYSNRNLTDGFVPDGALQRMDIFRDSQRAPWEVAEELVEAGLWKKLKNGYTVHDYLHHQQSREFVEAERKAARERMAKARNSRRSPEVQKSSPEVRQQAISRSSTTEVEVEVEVEVETEEHLPLGERPLDQPPSNGASPFAVPSDVTQAMP